MSKFDETSEDTGYKCPYCGYLDICDDWGYDYEGDILDCEQCGKKFYASAIHTVDFQATPNCELNGEEHKLRHFKNNAYFCEICNKCIIK